MLNKKGHIATWLLLLGTLILIISAWFIYLSFDGNLVRNAEAIREPIVNVAEDSEYADNVMRLIVQRAVDNGDKNDFVNSLKSAIVERSTRVERVSSVKGNFFEKLRKGEFEIKNTDKAEEYEFIMREVYVESSMEDNKVKRYFDLKFNFSSSSGQGL